MGGQSAFGTKAGDLFTRITVVTATIWIILCVASVGLLGGKTEDLLDPGLGGSPAAAEGGMQPTSPPSEESTPEQPD